MTAQIIKRQASYWDILDSEGLNRIHFFEKEEFHFVSSEMAGYLIAEEHLLLMDYESVWSNLYISSSASDPERVMRELKSRWGSYLPAQRSLYDYLTETDPVRMLQEGFGLFLHAPNPLASIAAKLLQETDVNFTLKSGRPARWPKKVLLAGDNFVVATSFKVEHRAA